MICYHNLRGGENTERKDVEDLVGIVSDIEDEVYADKHDDYRLIGMLWHLRLLTNNKIDLVLTD